MRSKENDDWRRVMADNGTVSVNNILLPTDFSEASIGAAAYALSIARQYKAKLYCLHVVDISSDAAGFYVPHQSYENLDDEMLIAAEEMLHNFTVKNLKGYKNIELRVVAGDPHKQIIKSIKQLNIDMCVMGTFGKAALERFFVGSTTERVMRKAICPVLIIPPVK